MLENTRYSIRDEIEQIGARVEYIDEATGEVKHKYKVGTKEFFSGSEYPVRVNRLTPEDDFVIQFPDYPFGVHASDYMDVIKFIVSFRGYYLRNKS